jgi:hypothetical protein
VVPGSRQRCRVPCLALLSSADYTWHWSGRPSADQCRCLSEFGQLLSQCVSQPVLVSPWFWSLAHKCSPSLIPTAAPGSSPSASQGARPKLNMGGHGASPIVASTHPAPPRRCVTQLLEASPVAPSSQHPPPVPATGPECTTAVLVYCHSELVRGANPLLSNNVPGTPHLETWSLFCSDVLLPTTSGSLESVANGGGRGTHQSNTWLIPQCKRSPRTPPRCWT